MTPSRTIPGGKARAASTFFRASPWIPSMTTSRGSAAMAFETRHAPKMKNKRGNRNRNLSGNRFTRASDR